MIITIPANAVTNVSALLPTTPTDSNGVVLKFAQGEVSYYLNSGASPDFYGDAGWQRAKNNETVRMAVGETVLWVFSTKEVDIDFEVVNLLSSGGGAVPTGAATEDKQDAQITELQEITAAIQDNVLKTAAKGSTTSGSPTSKNIDSNVQALHTVLVEAVKTNGVSASGLTPVAGTFSATGQSAHFTPIAGRDFNIQVLFSGAIGQVNLERSFDSINFYPITGSGVGIMRFTADANEQWGDSEIGVKYRLNCTALSAGTVSYRISQ